MSKLSPVIYIVDDDSSMCRSLARLVDSTGHEARIFASAIEFLKSQDRPSRQPACALLDLHMPELSGLEIQRALADKPTPCPVIFISGDDKLPSAVEAMKQGAVTFLAKPFDDDELLSAIDEALNRHRNTLAAEAGAHILHQRIDQLTARELEVMAWVITGLPNKQIAAALGITEATVKVHRHRVMEKMCAPSLPDLVRFCSGAKFAAAETDSQNTPDVFAVSPTAAQ
jgi:FixJ family two-component response regulator